MKKLIVIPILFNLAIFTMTAIQRSNYEIENYSKPVQLNLAEEKEEKSKELQCYLDPQCQKLAEAIFFEGRGESKKGQIAIAYTIVNRRDDWRWPDTINQVVTQKRKGVCQYSYECELNRSEKISKIEKEIGAWTYALGIAFDVFNFNVADVTDGADHYYNPAKVKHKPRFAKEYAFVETIGKHKFFRSN